MADGRQQQLAAAGAEVERLLAGDGDPDDGLRAAVAALHGQVPGYGWVGISFVDEGALLLGPWAGEERAPDAPPPVRVPIRFQGTTVAELGIAGPEPDAAELAALEHIATGLAAHCLVGWDTGGVPWDEL
jgi:hypothetical protein